MRAVFIKLLHWFRPGLLCLLASALHLLAPVCHAYIPGARGIRTADNQDGALPFQASSEYAQSNAYKAAQREILFKQVGIDQVARQQREEKLAQQLQQRNQEWGDQFKPQLADDIAQRGMAPVRRELKDLRATERQHVMETAYQQALRPGSGITAELMQNNPEFVKNWMNNQLDTIINGAPDTALPGVNNFANRPGVAGGAADMGAGGSADNGWDAVGFNPQQGVGPDGATSRGVDPNTGYVNGEPSWHQPATADTDGDGITNHVENSIGTNPDDAASAPTKFQLWNLQQKQREAALSAAQREAEAKQQKAEQEQRALEAEHQAQQDYEAEHPESVRQPGDVRVLDDENKVAEVSVEEGRPLVKVTRTNADGSTCEKWTTPTDEELADNFVKNAETGEWEKRDYTERFNNQVERFNSTALPVAIQKAQGSLDAFKEVNITAATIVAGGAGVSGAVPKIIAMGKEFISEATGIPTGIKDAKDFIRNLFTKKALKQADVIGIAASSNLGNVKLGKATKVSEINEMLRADGTLPEGYSLRFESRNNLWVNNAAGYGGAGVQADGTLKSVRTIFDGRGKAIIKVDKLPDGTIPISVDGRLTRNIDQLRGVVRHEVTEGNVLLPYAGQTLRSQQAINIGNSAHAMGVGAQNGN